VKILKLRLKDSIVVLLIGLSYLYFLGKNVNMYTAKPVPNGPDFLYT
jgi:hypothetical protein